MTSGAVCSVAECDEPRAPKLEKCQAHYTETLAKLREALTGRKVPASARSIPRTVDMSSAQHAQHLAAALTRSITAAGSVPADMLPRRLGFKPGDRRLDAALAVPLERGWVTRAGEDWAPGASTPADDAKRAGAARGAESQRRRASERLTRTATVVAREVQNAGAWPITMATLTANRPNGVRAARLAAEDGDLYIANTGPNDLRGVWPDEKTFDAALRARRAERTVTPDDRPEQIAALAQRTETVLADGPLTAAQLSTALGLVGKPRGLVDALAQLRRAGRIVSGTGYGYALASESTPRRPEYDRERLLERAVAAVEAADKPLSAAEIAKAIGLPPGSSRLRAEVASLGRARGALVLRRGHGGGYVPGSATPAT